MQFTRVPLWEAIMVGITCSSADATVVRALPRLPRLWVLSQHWSAGRYHWFSVTTACTISHPTEGGMEHVMDKTYVEYRDGVYYVANTRVTLDSLVYAYGEGH